MVRPLSPLELKEMRDRLPSKRAVSKTATARKRSTTAKPVAKRQPARRKKARA